MSSYIVSDSDLSAVASAIRTKGGTSAQLAFPAGFISAIGDIPSGGGYTVDDIASASTPYGNITISANTTIGSYAFYSRTGITGLTRLGTNSTGMNAFSKCTGLTTVNIPDGAYLSSYGFQGCTNLTSVYAPLSTMDDNVFNGCSKLPYVVFPSITHVYTSVWKGCSSLVGADLGKATNATPVSFDRPTAFSGCTKLKYLVLRSSTVVSLTNVNNLNDNTPFKSGGTGGTLYVPASLIASYQTATNWSTILGYANNQIKSIESTATDPDAPVDLTTHYIDGSLIPT